jgi:hypothetical protein
LALTAVVVLTATACGSSTSTDPAPLAATQTGQAQSPATTAPASPTDPPSAPTPSPVEVTQSEAVAKLPMVRGEDALQPRAAYGSRLLVESYKLNQIDVDPNVHYLLWDPATSAFSDLWSSEPYKQDLIGGIDGDWVVFTRTGFVMPFPDWSLFVRNLKTGESRTITTSDPAVKLVQGVQPTFPSGFAPDPRISNGTVVWNEIVPGAWERHRHRARSGL